ncbi:hypothetical protein L6452_39939 [Arctium lappa]|uniref:Uncharacterized protein n=1 Tax=Arctium lappa TaxID=4217 RepID=A0ACB8XUA1_ARCLA|nr:hypothetical protein L6452_39939 [Arctium lappa]
MKIIVDGLSLICWLFHSGDYDGHDNGGRRIGFGFQSLYNSKLKATNHFKLQISANVSEIPPDSQWMTKIRESDS